MLLRLTWILVTWGPRDCEYFLLMFLIYRDFTAIISCSSRPTSLSSGKRQLGPTLISKILQGGSGTGYLSHSSNGFRASGLRAYPIPLEVSSWKMSHTENIHEFSEPLLQSLQGSIVSIPIYGRVFFVKSRLQRRLYSVFLRWVRNVIVLESWV